MLNNIIRGFPIVILLTLPVMSVPGQTEDWLLGNFKEKSRLEIPDESQLVFTNGLISRTFSTEPNGATVGLDNLASRQSVIRSVRPEAVVEIDGIEYEVGGLEGQPVHNYLKKSWIKNMTVNPGSFKYIGYTLGEIEKRFEWKKRMDWLPKDMPWPPKGKTLTMTYKADDATISSLLGEMDSDMNREVLLEDKGISVFDYSSPQSIHRFKGADLYIMRRIKNCGKSTANEYL